jgi:hypothetical protein
MIRGLERFFPLGGVGLESPHSFLSETPRAVDRVVPATGSAGFCAPGQKNLELGWARSEERDRLRACEWSSGGQVSAVTR